MQRTFKRSVCVMILAAAVTVLSSSSVQAAPPQPAEGAFVVQDLIPTSVEPRGETCHIELTATFCLEGTFDGCFVADFFIVHFGACVEPAPQHFIASGTFVGEVDEMVGSFDFVFVGDIDIDGFAEGDLVVGHGTDDLKNLSGRITLSGLAGVAGNYEGRIHFAP